MRAKLSESGPIGSSGSGTITGYLRSVASKSGVDIDNLFVSMTTEEKLGINPKSDYNTPLGIYSYQLRYLLSLRTTSRLPFQGSAGYVNVFYPKSSSNIVNLSRLSKKEFDYYKNIIKNKYPSFDIEDVIKNTSRERIYSRGGPIPNTPGGDLWMVTFHLSRLLSKSSGKSFTLTWSLVFRNLGIDGVVDDGEGIIHPNEPTQSVFFTLGSLVLVDRVKNKESSDAIDDPDHGDLLKKVIQLVRLGRREEAQELLDGSLGNDLVYYVMYKKLSNLAPAFMGSGSLLIGEPGNKFRYCVSDSDFNKYGKIDSVSMFSCYDQNHFPNLRNIECINVELIKCRLQNLSGMPTTKNIKIQDSYIESFVGLSKSANHIEIGGSSIESFAGLSNIRNLDIEISSSSFTDLLGLPRKVRNLSLANLKDWSLRGCPEIVVKRFLCTDSNMKNLQYFPLKASIVTIKNTPKFSIEDISSVCDVSGNIFVL